MKRDDNKAIRFRLGGEEKKLTLDQFGIALGFYTREELDESPDLVVYTGAESTTMVDAFWHEIAPTDPLKTTKKGETRVISL
ncbi:hypothetical protein LINPERHAP1_LOCUS7470 [Linum perenne]